MSDRPMPEQPAAEQLVGGPEQAGADLPPGFDEFFSRHYAGAMAFAHSMTKGTTIDAEQAVVDAFTEVARRWGQFEDFEHAKAYLYKIIRRMLVKERKRLGKYQDPLWLRDVPEPQRPSDPGLSAEVRALLRFAWRHLPEKQRLVLWWHIPGFTSSEIAQELQMTPGVVRTHLQRARAKLSDAFGLWPEAGGKGTDAFAPGTPALERDPLADFLAASYQALCELFAADGDRKARIRAEVIARLGGGQGQAGPRRGDR